MPRDYMIMQVKAFKDGSRPATVMHQLSKGFTDEQIESVATYFAALKR
jgi:cytochrome c553